MSQVSNLATRLQTFAVLILFSSLFLFTYPPLLVAILLLIAQYEYHHTFALTQLHRKQHDSSPHPHRQRTIAQAKQQSDNTLNNAATVKSVADEDEIIALKKRHMSLQVQDGLDSIRVPFHSLASLVIGVCALHSLKALLLSTAAIQLLILVLTLVSQANCPASDLRPSSLAVLFSSVFSHLYISLPLSHSLLLYHSHVSSPLHHILFVILVVSNGEHCALLIGRLCGKHFPMKAISPNKSLEGLLAQCAGSIVTALALNFYWANQLSLSSFHSQSALSLSMPSSPPSFLFSALLGLCLALFAILGDLLESYLKRCVGKKDVSQMLPGVGGVCDRIDGLLFAFPVYYYYITEQTNKT